MLILSLSAPSEYHFIQNRIEMLSLQKLFKSARAGAYYIIAVTEDSTKVVLNGNGDPIHEMNKLMALSINSDA